MKVFAIRYGLHYDAMLLIVPANNENEAKALAAENVASDRHHSNMEFEEIEELDISTPGVAFVELMSYD